MFNKKEKLTEKDYYIELRNEVVMKIAMAKVDIQTLKGMPEDFVVGEKNLGKSMGLQAKQSINAKQAIEIKLKEIFALEKRLSAIDQLLETN